jgi:hypothetical protein
MNHFAVVDKKTRLEELSIADIATRVQGPIPAFHTAPQVKVGFTPRIFLTANNPGFGIEIVSHSRTVCVPGRCDGAHIST